MRTLPINFPPIVVLSLVLLLAGCNDRTPQNDQASERATHADKAAQTFAGRNNALLAPGDQAVLPADRDLTQRVRKALAMGSDFAAAKNISISTANGKVTLRGVVGGQREKMNLANIAKSVAGDGNVDDQLEVKANP